MAAAVFYLNDPAAPKPNRPAHLGVNILLEWDGKLLLERRRDCGMWGLPGGGVKGREPERRRHLCQCSRRRRTARADPAPG